MIEIGDEVETPTGHIGIVQSYQESHSVQGWDLNNRPFTIPMRYCQVRITDNEEWERPPGSSTTYENGKITSKIEWHDQGNLTRITMSEFTQACEALGEDYFA